MKSSDSLPRLSDKPPPPPSASVSASASASASAGSPKYLARLSWQKGLLDTSDASPSPTKQRGLASSLSAPALPTSAPWGSPGKPSTSSYSGPRTLHGAKTAVSPLSFDDSMDEVERMVRDHMAQLVQLDRQVGGKKPMSTLRQSAARRDPAKSEFDFAPLRDAAMLAATSELQSESDGLDEDDDVIEADGSGACAQKDRAASSGGNGDSSSKYFGAGAKAAYYKTYQELHGKPHLFIEKPKNQPQAKTLKTSSALSSALELRKASILLSMAKQQALVSSGDPPDNMTSAIKRRLALQPLRASLSGSPRASTGIDGLALSSPSLHSPRVIFLSGCIAKSHPAISLVLRKENCNVFNFSHQSLGDDFVIQFAACLPDLPQVEAINVSDNRLSDHALNELLLALENKPNLTKLDISENEIGRHSARSLRKYIASSLCTIKTLVLNDADIDDHECTLFMLAFERNKSVEKLLMASNRIGQTRKSMALGAAATVASTLPTDKDAAGALLPTGGEAIGSMLNVNLTIQELDLSWNMLRQSSTAPIANSLQLNYNLRELNLSYNGCGDGGAMQLGHALRSNSALQKLNLAYNSIGPKGSLVLASGLIVNKGLRELVLDGNSIGLDSGRELMHASCSRIHATAVCALSMFECNLASTKRAHVHDGKAGKDDLSAGAEMNVYNPSDPTGRYNLDLTDPYEHMIAHELLRLATFKRGYRFAKLEHATGGQPKFSTKIELHRQKQRKEAVAHPEQTQAAATQSSLSVLFSKIDKDNSGSVDEHELAEAMRAYGFCISDELLSRVLHEYDYDNSGALGVDEFEDFFLRCGFAMIDTDHSGALNEQEIEKVLKLMGFESITEREIKRMITQYDLNNSGEIDEQEFMEFMKAEILQHVLPHGVPPVAAGDDASTIAARSLEDKYERTALRDASGVIWKVPTSGFLAVEFHYDIDTVDEENDDAEGYGEHPRRGHHAHRTSQLTANSAISTLLENSQKMSKCNEEQADFLRAVLDTSDLFFTAAQAEDVMTKQSATKSWPRKLHALERILAQMVNRREAATLVNRMIDPARQWQQRRELRRVLPKLYSVVLGCPTNRYRFDLQNAVDRVALKHLAMLAQEEKLFSKNRSGRNDTSQNGDWENFRHARVNGHVWMLTSTFILNSLLGPSNLALLTKTAPTVAASAGGFVEASQVKRFIEFDYVSTTRPPRGSKALTSRRFKQLMDVWLNSDTVLKDDGAEPTEAADGGEVKSNAQLRWDLLRSHVRARRRQQTESSGSLSKMSIVQMKTTLDGIQKKIELLEMLVSDRWFSCEQAAELIAVMPEAIFARARAAVLLFSRIVDLENFIPIFDSMSREDQGECVKRLGWLNVVDPVQPDRQYPPLNLSIHDERELVQLLSKLALTEGRECWKRASYRPSVAEPTSTLNQALPLPLWGNPDATGDESLKHHGVVRLRYQSLRVPSLTGDDGELRCDMTVRLRLRKYTLCGTRLFLQEDIEELTHVMLSQAESVSRHRRLQRARRHQGSARVCQLIAVLGCFQFLVVTTLISVSILSPNPRSPSSADGVGSKLRRLEPPSPASQLNLWVQELLKARTVAVEINSTKPTNLQFSLRGTLVPRPSYPSLFDGEFAFSDAREPQHYVVIAQNRGNEWIASGDYGERLERSRCLHPAQVPPLHKLRSAFSTARWALGDSIELTFANDLFRVMKRNAGFHVTSSSGLHIQLTANDTRHQVLPDFVSKVQELPPCPRLFEDVEVTTKLSNTVEAVTESAVTQELAEEECPCTSKEKKTCLFLHGIGVHEDIGLIDTYPDYWGTIDRMLPCCFIVKFAHLNTVDSPWYDELFAERVCDALLSVAHNKTFTLVNTTRPRQHNRKNIPVVENTVVVAHSTGNLHLASALLYKKCQLDSESSKWIAIQGPIRGTNTANRVLEECTKPSSRWDALVQTVVREFELCPVKNSTKSLALAGTLASSGCLDKLYAKAQDIYETTVHANLCGVSPFGLTSTSSPKFVALATFSNHSSSDNDGVVELGSCAKRNTQYKATYRQRNRFYRASINHDDGRLIHGDGLWGDDRKPIKWLQCQF